jgi:hypothetical protein
MKRILLLMVLSSSFFLLNAQKYEPIKTQLVLNKYKEAKADLDKEWGNAKFTSKPEAWLLKAAIYSGLAMEEGSKGNPAGDKLAAEADAAFTKYKEMDPALSMVKDPIYQNGPINIYSSYYTSGYNDYKAKKWEAGFDKFQKAVEYSDMMIQQKIFPQALDTNVLILAGITAENSKKRDEAANYYSRLADSKLTGEGFESVYRYLVSYYFGKKDMVNFEKYKKLGKEMYPNSEFFDYDKVDFAVGLQEKLEDKIASVEQILATEPNDFKANQVLGEVIYDALNPREEKATIPANAAELETKMVNAFQKAAAAKAGYEIPYLYLGDHFINKAVKVNQAREALAADIKARTKPGTMASKEDVAKRDELDKKYGDELEKAREPYEKAAAIFATKSSMEAKDKQQYKKAASYLADIYAWKKAQSKGNAAQQAKYAAEEKKWNDRWESIK